MAHQRNDDLGPALLALGALALGLVATIALWSAHRTTEAAGAERRVRTTTDGVLEHGERTFAYGDAGVALAPLGTSPVDRWLANVLPGEEELDPQILAMRRLLLRADDAGVASFWPYRSTGHAVRAEGVPGVVRDAACDLRVLPVGTESGFNCVVRVRCGGVVVYPDDALEAGYAPCDVVSGIPRSATDENPTLRDGDPELVVDLDSHLARVRDLRGDGESYIEIRLD